MRRRNADKIIELDKPATDVLASNHSDRDARSREKP